MADSATTVALLRGGTLGPSGVLNRSGPSSTVSLLRSTGSGPGRSPVTTATYQRLPQIAQPDWAAGVANFKKQQKPQSLLGTIGGLVAGIPGGIMGLAKDTYGWATGPVRATIDAIRGKADWSDVLGASAGFLAAGPVALMRPGSVFTERTPTEWESKLTKYNPLFTHLATGIRRTGERLAATAVEPFGPEWGAESYGEAYHRGGAGGVLTAGLEDVGNLSLAAMVAAPILGATRVASLARLAPELTAGEATAGEVAAATAAPLTAGEVAAAAAPKVAGAVPGTTGAELARAAVERFARPRGLAGLAEKAGAPRLAAGLDTAAQVARQIEHLGATSDPTYWAGKLVRNVGEKAVSTEAAQRLIGEVTERFPRLSDTGRKLAEMSARMWAGQAEESRAAADAVRATRGLTDLEDRMIVPILDGRYEQMRGLYESVTPEVFDRVAARQFGPEVSGRAHLTGPEIREVLALGPDGAAATGRMKGALDAFHELAARRTSQRLAGFGRSKERPALNEEQVMTAEELAAHQGPPPDRTQAGAFAAGAEEGVPYKAGQAVMGEAVKAEQARRLPKLLQAIESQAEVAGKRAKQDRITAAYEALVRDMPQQTAMRDLFKRGQVSGLATGEARRAAGDYTRAGRELERLVEDYADAVVRNENPATLAEREARIEQLTQQVSELHQQAETAARRVNAATGLAPATGEVVPGPRRVLLRDVAGDVVTGEGTGPQVIQEAPRPVPEAVALPAEGRLRVTEVRRRIGEARAANRADALRQREALFGPDPLVIPRADRPGGRGGEYDWLEQMGQGERTRMFRGDRPWFVSEDPKLLRQHGNFADQLAEEIAYRTGRDVTPDEAVQEYLDLYRSGESVKGAADRVAQDLGIEPSVLADINERGKVVVDALEADLRAEVGQLHQDLLRLPDDQKAELVQMMGLLDSSGSADSVFGELLAEVVPDLMDTGGLGQRLENRGLSYRDILAAGLQPFDEFFTAERGPIPRAALRQQGVLGVEATQARQALREGEQALRAGQRGVVNEAMGGVREEEAALRAVERGNRRVDTARERAETMAARADVTEGVLGPTDAELAVERANQPGRVSGFSRNQKLILKAGQHQEKSAHYGRLERQLARTAERRMTEYENVPVEMARSFQDRLVQDVNEPYIRGQIGKAQQAVERDELGRAIRDENGKTIPAVDEAGEPIMEWAPGSTVKKLLADVVDPRRRDNILEELLLTADGLDANGVRLNAPQAFIDTLMGHRDAFSAEGQNLLDRSVAGWRDRRAKLLAKGIEARIDLQLESAPARYRRVLQHARRQVRALLDEADALDAAGHIDEADALRSIAEDVPTTVTALDKAGIDPMHMIGGVPLPAELRRGSGRGGRPLPSGKTTQLAGEQTAESGLGLVSGREYAQLESAEGRRRAANEVNRQVAEQFTQPAGDVVPGLRDAGPLPTDTMTKLARDAGYVPFTGEVIEGPTTPVIRDWMQKQMRAWEKEAPAAFKLIGKGNAQWKKLVLLSPRWQTGNILSGAMQGLVWGDMTPWSYGRNVVRYLDALRKGGARETFTRGGLIEGLPPELVQTGISTAEREMLGMVDKLNLPPAENASRMAKLRYQFNRLSETNVNFNEFVDGIYRGAAYLTYLEKGHLPKAAIDNVNRTYGNYAKMTPFERNIVRQVIPFYSWLRHQTGAMSRLAIDNPARIALYANMGRLYSEDDAERNAFDSLIGPNIPFLGGRLPISGLVSPVPQTDEAGGGVLGGLLPLADPRSIAASLSPVLSAPILLGTGMDPQRLDRINRPPSEEGKTSWGTAAVGPLPVGTWPWLLSSYLPQARSLRDLVGAGLSGGDVQRYRTGEFVTNARTGAPRRTPAAEQPPLGVPLTSLLSLLGVPTPQSTQRLRSVISRNQRG